MTELKSILAIGESQTLNTLKASIRYFSPDCIMHEASSETDAVEKAVSLNVDIIFIQIQLSFANSFELGKYFKNNDFLRRIPLVFLTSKNNKHLKSQALQCGADAFLSTPIDLNDFITITKALLNNASQETSFAYKQRKQDDLVEEHISELVRENRLIQSQAKELQTGIERHKETLKKLKQSEEKFRKLFEDHKAVKLLVDPENGDIIDANNAAVEFYKWSRRQLQKMNIKQINIHSEAEIEEAFHQVRKNNREYFEFKHKTATGAIRNVAVYTSKVSVDGRILLHSIIHDISESKRIYDALAANENRLNRAELASKTGNWELRLDTKEMFASGGARKIYGLTGELFDYEFVKNIPLPEYRSVLDKAIINLIKGKEPYNIDFKIKAFDTGIIKDIHSEAVYDDKRKTVFGIIQDITDRKLTETKIKESEEKYRMITENTFDVIWILNLRQMRFTYVSPAIFEQRGYTVEESMNQSLEDVLTPESLKIAQQLLADTVEKFLKEKNSDATRQVTQIQQPCKNGKIIWVEIATQLQYNSDGEIEVLGVSRNIQERKRLEYELRELIATKDKFFSIIAHDLKSPFTGIIGLSELLIDEEHSLDVNEIMQYARLINTTAKNTLILLENLLDWAQLQRGQILYNPKRILMAESVKEVLALSKQSASQKEISIQSVVADDLIIAVDENMFKVVIRNLIANAVKFTRIGGKVEVIAESNDKTVRISVKDNGVGISNENLEKLFSISSGYVVRGTANEKGTGLGLILCREFVEKLGGTINVESEVGKGSVFTVELPIKKN